MAAQVESTADSTKALHLSSDPVDLQSSWAIPLAQYFIRLPTVILIHGDYHAKVHLPIEEHTSHEVLIQHSQCGSTDYCMVLCIKHNYKIED